MSIDEKALAIVKDKWGTRAPVTLIIEAYEAAKAAKQSVSISREQLHIMADTMTGRHGLAYATKGKDDFERKRNRYLIEIKSALNAAEVSHVD